MKHVALLRGVNVGGKNKIPMVALAGLFTEAGCRDVQTYIQSGNVVFDVPAQAAKNLCSVVCSRIQTQFGFHTCVVLRSSSEMAQITASNPYPDVERSHVVFLDSQPTPEQVVRLDPNRSLPDQFRLEGRHIYLHLPNGVSNTKLTNAYFDARLKTVSTVRNWRTVLQLLAMMAG